MNSLLPLLILLILGVIYVGTSGDNNSLIGIFAIIIALLFFFMIDNQQSVEQFQSEINTCGYNDPRHQSMRWNQVQQKLLNSELRNYNNISLQSDPDPARNYPLVSSVVHTTPPGEDISHTNLSPDNNVMFAHNQSSPDCCPSTFSDSRGCICTTQEQRDYINSRGGNRRQASVY
tara:strand:+ start:1289 stop:1813 length:525 start_codon:yes stop_codon:yes gene_type:complete